MCISLSVQGDEVDCLSSISGSLYRGRTSVTTSGRRCQRWDSQNPHAHDVHSMPGDESLTASANFCRAPVFDALGPWCFTEDPDVRFEYCNITKCADGEQHRNARSHD
ncbi:hypothetical protein CAPTEDRAFT_107008 [Capitella teleta]|uniref:Kringle domain-containing protein n=1 Tax=Capitella teleta TaxID=283909 RepID=R7TIW1_CAPTE|nr:hypothetical protein CAPTEDRAFT_107008 [Capitella teleta]|eukprot:ELT91481.1 hypothetical protein CAPTEDRAFT_107008 [Capitella teleta]